MDLQQTPADSDSRIAEREVPVPARLTPPGLVHTVRSMNVAAPLAELPLEAFAAKLLGDTLDGILGATTKQAETYQGILADLQKPIPHLAEERIGEAQISAFLAERWPDHMGGTVVRRDYTFEDTPGGDGAIGRTANEKLRQVVDSLRREAPLLAHGARLGLPDPPPDARSFSYLVREGEDQISRKVRPAVAQRLAEMLREQLHLLARTGVPRLVVSGGEVAAKVTFKLSATDAERREIGRAETEALGASVRGGRNGFARAAASAALGRIVVSPINEETFDPVAMSSAVVGELRLRFTAETFPPGAGAGESAGEATA